MHFLCIGVKRAGVTAVCYVENGRVIIKTLPSPKPIPCQAPQGVNSHG